MVTRRQFQLGLLPGIGTALAVSDCSAQNPLPAGARLVYLAAPDKDPMSDMMAQFSASQILGLPQTTRAFNTVVTTIGDLNKILTEGERQEYEGKVVRKIFPRISLPSVKEITDLKADLNRVIVGGGASIDLKPAGDVLALTEVFKRIVRLIRTWVGAEEVEKQARTLLPSVRTASAFLEQLTSVEGGQEKVVNSFEVEERPLQQYEKIVIVERITIEWPGNPPATRDIGSVTYKFGHR